MPEENPYVQPSAPLQDETEDHAETVAVFAAGSRIGRVRYMAYLFGGYFVVGILAAILAFIGDATGVETVVVFAIGALSIAYLVMMVVWTVRRVRDFDMSGWFAILFILPLINFALWFVPGTNGQNRFGLKPPPNGVGVIILSCSALLIPLAGIAAAIAIPAYSDFTGRAKISEGVVSSSPHRTSLGIACADGTLSPDLSIDDFGLSPPEAYASAVVKSVGIEVKSRSTGVVRIAFQALGGGIEEGDELVYTGTCDQATMTWAVEGTMPERFWPKL